MKTSANYAVRILLLIATSQLLLNISCAKEEPCSDGQLEIKNNYPAQYHQCLDDFQPSPGNPYWFKVYVDGKDYGAISMASTSTLSLEPGTHIVEIRHACGETPVSGPLESSHTVTIIACETSSIQIDP